MKLPRKKYGEQNQCLQRMEKHLPSPPNGSEATKISKSKRVVPVSNLRASTTVPAKDSTLIKAASNTTNVAKIY